MPNAKYRQHREQTPGTYQPRILPLSVKDITGDSPAINTDQFAKLSLQSKKQVMRALEKGINRNIDRLEKKFGKAAWNESPALRGLDHMIHKAVTDGTWGPNRTDRFSVNNLTDEQLTKQFSILSQFANNKTATVTGMSEYRENVVKGAVKALDDLGVNTDKWQRWYKNLGEEKKTMVWRALRAMYGDDRIKGMVYKKGSGEIINEIRLTMSGHRPPPGGWTTQAIVNQIVKDYYGVDLDDEAEE